VKTLNVKMFLEETDKYLLVDVRSSGEYLEASIPGAVNVPLFDDEERAAVGCTYKEEGTEKAKIVGLYLVAPKLPLLVDTIVKEADGREILLYCWRGGMRSRSLAVVLDVMNYPVSILHGGYKAFRRSVVSWLNNAAVNKPVFVLNGLTGVGKTLVIKQLMEMGVPAIDLENMANHRGSVFGSIGLGRPRSQKDFEALLFLELKKHEFAPYLIMEGEGKRIGPVVLPDFIFKALCEGPHILLETGIDVRAARITEQYSSSADDNKEQLVKAVLSLEKRLGKQRCQDLADKIILGYYDGAARSLCLDYYDSLYGESRKLKESYLEVIDVTEAVENYIQ